MRHNGKVRGMDEIYSGIGRLNLKPIYHYFRKHDYEWKSFGGSVYVYIYKKAER